MSLHPVLNFFVAAEALDIVRKVNPDFAVEQKKKSRFPEKPSGILIHFKHGYPEESGA